MLRQAVPTSNNHGKQGTCTRLLLLGERKSFKHGPRSKISTTGLSVLEIWAMNL
jgi:hypothetical protein